MKRINKTDRRIQRTAYGWLAVVMGVPFGAAGTYLLLGSLALAPMPGGGDGPVWMLGAVGITFLVAGLTILFLGTRSLWYKARLAAREQRYPRQPWRYDYLWNPEGVRDEAGRRVFSLLMITIFMPVFLVPFNWWAFFSDKSMLPIQVLTGLFDAIAVVVAVTFVYHLLRFAKYGYTTLLFARFPFYPGETLSVRMVPDRFQRFDATLRFVEEGFEAHGHGSTQRIDQVAYEHHSETKTIRNEGKGGPARIEFKIPDNPEWVDQLRANPTVRYWEVVIEAQEPGVDFRTTFPVPVYPDSGYGSQSNPRFETLDRAGGRTARIPFEAKLVGVPALLVLIVALAWPQAPSRLRDLGIAVRQRVASMQPLATIPGVSAGTMDAVIDGRGNAWVLSKYDLTRFATSDPQNGRRYLNTSLYRKTFGHNMDALSSVLVVNDDDIWAGSWYGELLHYRNGQWHEAVPRTGSPLGRIRALTVRQGALYVGGKGLWRWDPNEARLQRVSTVPDATVHALATAVDGSLLVSAGDAVGRLQGGRWQPLWKAPDHAGAVQALTVDADGHLVVGTHSGMTVLNRDGTVVRRELSGYDIHAFAYDGRHRLWVATFRHGALVRSAGGWTNLSSKRRLPARDVHDLGIDGRGRLWLAVYSKGAVTVAPQDLPD